MLYDIWTAFLDVEQALSFARTITCDIYQLGIVVTKLRG